MPRWWRKFTFKRIEKHYLDEKAKAEKTNTEELINPKKPKIHKADIAPSPTYTSKATKK